jgi:hypothetical protein
MKLSRGLVVAGMFLVYALQVHHGQARGPSTPEERAKVVSLTRSLERDPFGENAATARQWLREWIIEVPDIRVYACAELLGHGMGGKYRRRMGIRRKSEHLPFCVVMLFARVVYVGFISTAPGRIVGIVCVSRRH